MDPPSRLPSPPPRHRKKSVTFGELSGDDGIGRGGGSDNESSGALLGLHPHHLHDGTSAYVMFLTAMAAVGGFLFGYDTGVISGAMLKIREDFGLSEWEQEVVVSVTVAGAIAGSALGGPANQRFGRRPVILFAAITFTFGAFLMAVAETFYALAVGRLVVGVAIGAASLTTPIYIAESAPAQLRGTLVTLNTLLVTFGQVIAGIVDGALSRTDGGWRYMLGLSAVPGAVMAIGFLFLPESPRWLADAGRPREALAVLQRVRGTADVREELEEMLQVAAKADGHNGGGGNAGSDGGYTLRDAWRELPVRRALLLGCGLQALQQFSGINTVMYYSASIFAMAGFDDNAAIWLAAYSALSQALGVCLGMYYIEWKGRRKLILFSLAMVALMLALLGATFGLSRATSAPVVPSAAAADAACQVTRNVFWGDMVVDSCYQCLRVGGCGFCADAADGAGHCYSAAADTDVASSGATDVLGRCVASAWQTRNCGGKLGGAAALFVVLYLFCFGIGMSGVPWTVNAEIYPTHARSICTAASTSVNWVGNVVVSATFLTLASPRVLSTAGAFWLYAVLSAAGWCWLWGSMPETKGLSLEEIRVLFLREGDPGWAAVSAAASGEDDGSITDSRGGGEVGATRGSGANTRGDLVLGGAR